MVPEEPSFENDRRDDLSLMRQEIEFIGYHMNKDVIKQFLDRFLCTDGEYACKQYPPEVPKAQPKTNKRSGILLRY